MQHSAKTQDQLRGDVAQLLRQVEDARAAADAASADAPTVVDTPTAPATTYAEQQEAVRDAVEAIAQRLKDDGAAADAAQVVHAQAERIMSQSQTV